MPTPQETDSRFGDWVVQYAIAKGTYGTVHLVTHAENGTVAAAKHLLKTRYNKQSIGRDVSAARRLHELAYLAPETIAVPFEVRHLQGQSQLEIARIRTLLDNDWDPTQAGNIISEYLIFAPLMSTTLRSVIVSEVPDVNREIFFTQLLEAIDFLHQNRLCHRDIKPENILLKSYDSPRALVTDFGCVSDQQVILYDRPGTIPYLALEQEEGFQHGPAVDYWACGVVGYELLIREHTGNERIGPGRNLERCHQMLRYKPTDMAKCCIQMLQSSPDCRMTATEALGWMLPDQTCRNADHGPEEIVADVASKRTKRQ